MLTLSPDAGRGRAAKDANPTTLPTRFAEELRRAPGAGGGDVEMFESVNVGKCECQNIVL